MGEPKLEFVANFLSDLAKAIFTVGIASVFFREFPLIARGILWGSFAVLAVVSIVIYPNNARRGGP